MPARHDYYKNVAQNIINKRSELGIFTYIEPGAPRRPA